MLKRSVIAVCLFTLPTAVMAQRGGAVGGRGGDAAAPARQTGSTEVTVFRLSYMTASSAAKIVGQTLQVETVVDDRTNSLVVSCSEAQQQQVRNLIAKIDVAEDTAASASDLTVVPIMNRDVEQIMVQLSKLFRGELTVTSDNQGRQILMRGSADAIEKAQRVIDSLDTPLPTAMVEVAFFQVGAKSDSTSREIPADLLAVAKQIERFGKPQLIGRMATSAVEGEDFSVDGQIADQMYVHLKGRLDAAPADGTVRLRISTELTMAQTVQSEDDDASASRPPQRGHRPQAETPRFSVGTTLITRRGDYVVMGSAPLGWTPGESVVTVVHIPESPK